MKWETKKLRSVKRFSTYEMLGLKPVRTQYEEYMDQMNKKMRKKYFDISVELIY